MVIASCHILSYVGHLMGDSRNDRDNRIQLLESAHACLVNFTTWLASLEDVLIWEGPDTCREASRRVGPHHLSHLPDLLSVTSRVFAHRLSIHSRRPRRWRLLG